MSHKIFMQNFIFGLEVESTKTKLAIPRQLSKLKFPIN